MRPDSANSLKFSSRGTGKVRAQHFPGLFSSKIVRQDLPNFYDSDSAQLGEGYRKYQPGGPCYAGHSVVRKTRRNTGQGLVGEGHREGGGNSADFGKLGAQFVSGAEQGVLDCALSRIQEVGHGFAV